MARQLSNESSLDNLKREAKRWLRALRENDAAARERLLRAVPIPNDPPTLRDVQHALAREHGMDGWNELTAEVERIRLRRAATTANGGDDDQTRDEQMTAGSAPIELNLVSLFLRTGSPDRRLISGAELRMARGTASRLHDQHSQLARENIFTAVVAGNVDRVRELVSENPTLASTPDAERNWPPLLYLSNAHLRQPSCHEHAVEIATLLLDLGADPNGYNPGGAELIGYDEGGIHFTVLTNVIGRGEGRIPPHPRMRDLVPLLLERGANPYDKQVLYNVFADHSSRADLNDDIIWLMDLLYEHSVRAGHEADWKDPLWRMLDVGSYGPGSNFLMMAAVATNSLGLTEWLLQHGAGPDVRSDHPRYAQFRALEYAVRSGNAAMQALLSRYGAKSASNLQLSPYEAFARACMNGDREFARTEIAKHPEWTRIPHALMIAAREDNADAVRLLLELGVSPDIEEGRRARALHTAAFRGATNAAKVLLEAGADPDARETGYNSTPMGVASFAQQTAMTDLLADYSRDVFNLVFAGKVQRVREVLAEDASLAKGRTPNGESMLMRLPDDEDIAVQLVELLLANGADPTLTDRNGLTAAALAERRALTRVVDLLRG